MKATLPQEYAKFWYDAELEHLELLRAHYISHTFVPHSHEGFAIGVIESGGQAFNYGRTTNLIMPAGSIAAINPGVVHTGKAASEQGWTYRMLYPSASLLQRAASELVGRPCDTPFFPEPVIYDPFLMRRMQRMHHLLEDPTTTRLERESRLLWTLAQLIARHAMSMHEAQGVAQEPAAVTTVRAFLDAHFAENISLDQLAELVHLSPFHLLRVFRRSLGLPPHAYLLQARITRARELLRSEMPLAEIALQTGFSDQSHLHRHFKRILGITPGQYRAQR